LKWTFVTPFPSSSTDFVLIEAHPFAQKQIADTRFAQKQEVGSMTKLTQGQLADRWHISPRTLEQWRWLGKGPRFLKIGARVLYDEDEIEVYEAAQRCQSTFGPVDPEGA
jgi:hypothetical protein